MKIFTYNDMLFSLEPVGGKWDIVCKRADDRTAYLAVGVFPAATEAEAEIRARALVRTICPVGVRVVGPDVARPIRIGDLRIVAPDVVHPAFVYWDKDSSSCPKSF